MPSNIKKFVYIAYAYYIKWDLSVIGIYCVYTVLYEFTSVRPTQDLLQSSPKIEGRSSSCGWNSRTIWNYLKNTKNRAQVPVVDWRRATESFCVPLKHLWNFEFQNGIWLPSVCSTSPADLWRGGGRSADSTLMGRPTKAALRLCSLDPALTGLAGHRDNELQTRESAALSPWNLVVGSGGRDWAQSDPARLWEAWACHALPAQSFWNFLHTSPCRIFPAVMYGGHIPREHFHICLSARKKMPHCMIWLFIILRKLLTIASEHAPQLRISAWTEFREMFIVECVPRGMPYKRESRTWSLRMLLVVWCMCHGWHVGK